jgi:putative FmdB family regulatory protein
MPIFDYKCPKCSATKDDELVQSHTTKVKCPECDTIMNKKISAPNLGRMNQHGQSY